MFVCRINYIGIWDTYGYVITWILGYVWIELGHVNIIYIYIYILLLSYKLRFSAIYWGYFIWISSALAAVRMVRKLTLPL